MSPDVVSVQLEDASSLRVCFADGTAGRVTFLESHLTGVFEPLRDPAFFARVHVHEGFVTWPGEIDLAPDAMYAAISATGEWRLS